MPTPLDDEARAIPTQSYPQGQHLSWRRQEWWPRWREGLVPVPKGWAYLGQLFPTPPSYFLGGKRSSTGSAGILSALLVTAQAQAAMRTGKLVPCWGQQIPHQHHGTLELTHRRGALGSGPSCQHLEEVSSPSLPAPLPPAALGGPGLGCDDHTDTALCLPCGRSAPTFLFLLTVFQQL